MGGNRKHTQVQPQPIQMFAVTIEPASAETRERMITSEIPAGVDRFNPDRVREIATFGYFAPTQIATHPETGEPLVVFSATFTVPLNLVCGYIPPASRLLGPQGSPVNVEKALHDAFAPFGQPLARIELRSAWPQKVVDEISKKGAPLR